ncbi:MAG: hypothetical protein IIZ23_09215, partial [Ruminococcus sp.]|nr:hypothetical protein [Ruminococcus sp.]
CVVNCAQGIDDTTTGKEGKVFYSGVSNPTQPYATSPGTIIVHGGTFAGRMSDSNWGNYVIDGGTFDRNTVILNENPVDANGNRVATASGSMATLPNSPGTLEEAGWLAPGYKVVANGDGTYGVAKKLFVGHNLRLGGNIGVNFFINSKAADFANAQTATVTFTWDKEYKKTVDLKTLTTDANGYYKASVEVVAAQMAHKIHAVVYLDGEALAQTDDYSVQDYAETVFKNPAAYDDKGKPKQLRALAKAMLNYGAQAQNVFASSLKDKTPAPANTTVGNNGYTNVTADAVTAKIHGSASNLENVAEQLNAKYYTNSLIYLQNNTLRVYFTPKTYPSTMPNAGAYDGNLSNYYYYKDVEGIAVAELDEQQVFTVGNVTFKYSALNYVVNVLNSGDKMNDAQKDLAASLFLYNQAANAYF